MMDIEQRLHAMITQKSEQYVAERKSHEKTRADLREATDTIARMWAEIDRKTAALKAAMEITGWARNGITQQAMFVASCDRVHEVIGSALLP